MKIRFRRDAFHNQSATPKNQGTKRACASSLSLSQFPRHFNPAGFSACVRFVVPHQGKSKCSENMLCPLLRLTSDLHAGWRILHEFNFVAFRILNPCRIRTAGINFRIAYIRNENQFAINFRPLRKQDAFALHRLRQFKDILYKNCDMSTGQAVPISALLIRIVEQSNELTICDLEAGFCRIAFAISNRIYMLHFQSISIEPHHGIKIIAEKGAVGDSMYIVTHLSYPFLFNAFEFLKTVYWALVFSKFNRR